MNKIGSNPLSSMLDNVFQKVDRNKDGKLDKQEFAAFYEVTKAGIAKNNDGSFKVSEQNEWDRMDANGDGAVTDAEIQKAGVLMPASLSDDTLEPMIAYLLQQKTASAAAAANLLMADSDSGVDKTSGI